MRRLKNTLLWCGAVLMSVTVMAEDPAATCDKLVATGNPEYPPYLWRDPDTRRGLMGANELILKAVSQRLGIPIEVVYTGPWSRAQEEVRAGRVDLIAGAFYTEPRSEYMHYIRPAFLTTRSVLWKRTFVDIDYSEWDDLQAYDGATVINNSFGQAFDSYARDNLKIETVASLEQAFRMLAQGRVDYVLYEEFPGQAYSDRLNLTYVIETANPPISQEELYLTLSHRSKCNTPELRGALERIMREITRDGTAEAALQAGLEAWHDQNPASGG
ncbi:substrate-binding periplasmic protein [Saccharospirillum salsuginis]|uniref:Solute-binding protein family 3/N-terminal domain-containing protein n=1 Tax=Saccharospirillum salsuginis TaxID=418750 RepID=A0A918KRM4_9GAMM|nr:transporter substrate-binding domain-containing protein [Saccharospirillum salsuginis]GGX73119.1 hypothetical protein GCM10007392_45730 [Saccharospirillum salsuginis]